MNNNRRRRFLEASYIEKCMPSRYKYRGGCTGGCGPYGFAFGWITSGTAPIGDRDRSMLDVDAEAKKKQKNQNGFRKRRRRFFLAATPLIHHDRHDRHPSCTHLAHPYPRLTSHIHTLHIPYTNLTHPYPHHTLHIPRNLMDDHLLAYQFLNRF